MPITITRVQRDTLYGELVGDLAGIALIRDAIRERNYETARRMRSRYELEMRLLDDIGWAPDDPGAMFEITMPDEQLSCVLQQLCWRAAMNIGSTPCAGTTERVQTREVAILAVCGELLTQIPRAEQ